MKVCMTAARFIGLIRNKSSIATQRCLATCLLVLTACSWFCGCGAEELKTEDQPKMSQEAENEEDVSENLNLKEEE